MDTKTNDARHVDADSGAQLTETPANGDPWERWMRSRARVRTSRGLERSDNSRSLLTDLASNDYLGLSGAAHVRAACAAAATEHGSGASASRVATGTFVIHRELERALCEYTGRDQAIVFSSGYTANIGVLGALGGAGSLFILDAHAHASLIDGARLSGAQLEMNAHNSLKDIESLLLANLNDPAPKARVAVIVESIYSVLGDGAPLVDLADLCARYGALLIVDEAHSLAASAQGSSVRAAGLATASNVIMTATLAKALGAQGGAIIMGGQHASLLREHIVNTARTFLFDTALAPPAAAAARAALELATPALIDQLLSNARLICRVLAEETRLANRIEPGIGAVQSVRMLSPEQALAVSSLLRERGIAVACFRPPSVPDGISRLRITAHANHPAEGLAETSRIIAQTIVEVES